MRRSILTTFAIVALGGACVGAVVGVGFGRLDPAPSPPPTHEALWRAVHEQDLQLQELRRALQRVQARADAGCHDTP